MNPILPKHEMTEEDIKLQFITPAIIAKWSPRRITVETQITDGRINLRGNLASPYESPGISAERPGICRQCGSWRKKYTEVR